MMCDGVCRSLGIRRWRCAVEVCFHPAVKIVALPEATHKYDAAYQTTLLPYAVHLPLHQVDDLLDHWIEDLFDLFCAHDKEA